MDRWKSSFQRLLFATMVRLSRKCLAEIVGCLQPPEQAYSLCKGCLSTVQQDGQMQCSWPQYLLQSTLEECALAGEHRSSLVRCFQRRHILPYPSKTRINLGIDQAPEERQSWNVVVLLVFNLNGESTLVLVSVHS